MKNPFLIGDTIYLRPLEHEDASLIQPWVNDPDVSRFLLVHLPMNKQVEERFIDAMSRSENDIVLVIVRIQDDVPVGLTGFHQIQQKNRNAVFGINIGDKECWGQGYGTEATGLMMQFAFDKLNLNRITLHVFEFNDRAHHVYKKLGFQEEGVLRQDHYCEGQYWDTIIMGMLRDEWRELMLASQGTV